MKVKEEENEYIANSPTVFLSHSSRDENFIGKLNQDLKNCHCNTWLYTTDIRHGRNWMDAIFRGGIGKCDSVIVYLTENSIESEMVKREIDAALIRKLKDSSIGFLPYVNSSELRSKLRPDLQSLQIPEWNKENYLTLLPQVITEVWHSFTERAIELAVSSERAKRLALELRVKEYAEESSATVFKQNELLDFQFIKDRLDRNVEVPLDLYIKDEKGDNKASKNKYTAQINVLALLLETLDAGYRYYEQSITFSVAKKYASKVQGLNDSEAFYISKRDILLLESELQMLGMIQMQSREGNPFGSNRTSIIFPFTSKAHRFRYWITYNHIEIQNTICEIAME